MPNWWKKKVGIFVCESGDFGLVAESRILGFEPEVRLFVVRKVGIFPVWVEPRVCSTRLSAQLLITTSETFPN